MRTYNLFYHVSPSSSRLLLRKLVLKCPVEGARKKVLKENYFILFFSFLKGIREDLVYVMAMWHVGFFYHLRIV